MKQKVTLKELNKKAEEITMYMNYLVRVEKDSYGYYVVQDYGMEGSDVVFAGTPEECAIYLDRQKEMLDI